MKEVKITDKFEVLYKERISKNIKLKKEFLDALESFLYDRYSVDDHLLEGKMSGFRSFSVSRDCRVVYTETEKFFLLHSIGTHKQLYRR